MKTVYEVILSKEQIKRFIDDNSKDKYDLEEIIKFLVIDEFKKKYKLDVTDRLNHLKYYERNTHFKVILELPE